MKNFINWFKRILGFNDKKQIEAAEEVANYVHDKKNEYTVTMGKHMKKAKDTHEQTRQIAKESTKLDVRVMDVTQQIYMVTGHR